MKERGIIFSAPMVRAILAGRKSQTRRIVKPQPLAHHGITKCWGTSPDGFEFGEKYVWTESGPDYPDGPEDERRSPYGVPGERLWVRETWAPVERAEDHADESFSPIENTREAADRWVEAARNDHTGRWRPPIFMPRWASRIVLEVVEVRCQRLHAITADDAIAEGMRLHHDGRWWRGAPHKVTGFPRCMPTARDAYADLWDTMHAKRNPWGSNPWVWAVTFRRLQP